MQRTPALTLLASAIAVLLAACTTSTPAPVVDRTARPVVAPAVPPRAAPVAAPAVAAPSGSTAGSQFYVVQKGDTLYGVARANSVDPATLAGWNGLPAGAGLREGQVLRLAPPGAAPTAAPTVSTAGTTVAAAPAGAAIHGQPLPASGPAPVITPPPAPAPTTMPPTPAVTPVEAPLKRDPRAQRVPYSDEAMAAMQRGEAAATAPSSAASAPATTVKPAAVPASSSAPAPASAATAPGAAATPPAAVVDLDVKPGGGVEREGITWSWPVGGRVTSKFNDKAPMKGIDILAAAGAPVVAAATGKVIYVGKEPRGFGQMIVVSHAKETVSVYFHTDKVQVKEQQRVLLGQKLAEVASGEKKMHFEVRRQGRPIDPVALMPK